MSPSMKFENSRAEELRGLGRKLGSIERSAGRLLGDKQHGPIFLKLRELRELFDKATTKQQKLEYAALAAAGSGGARLLLEAMDKKDRDLDAVDRGLQCVSS